jgi:hypothetical protein
MAAGNRIEGDMDTIADIQTALEQDMSKALAEHATISNVFSSIWKAADRLASLHGYDEKTSTFISATVLQGAQPALIVLEHGDPSRASWLVIHAWQECAKEISLFKAPIPETADVLKYCDGVLDFIDAEIRFS